MGRRRWRGHPGRASRCCGDASPSGSGSRRAAEAQLAQAIGISPASLPQIASLSSLPLPEGLPASVDSLLQQAVSTRPDLAAKFADVRAREAELERARADYLPKLSANGALGRVYRELDSLNLGPNGTTFYPHRTVTALVPRRGVVRRWLDALRGCGSRQLMRAGPHVGALLCVYSALRLNEKSEKTQGDSRRRWQLMRTGPGRLHPPSQRAGSGPLGDQLP